MTPKVAKQVEARADLTVAELRERCAEVLGEHTQSRHKEVVRKRITWRVLDNRFEHCGQVYRLLTAVAKAITGSHWNGYGFFGVLHKRAKR
jgi:hypothetical protein